MDPINDNQLRTGVTDGGVDVGWHAKAWVCVAIEDLRNRESDPRRHWFGELLHLPYSQEATWIA